MSVTGFCSCKACIHDILVNKHGHLYGYKWFDSMNGIGRVESGTETEITSGRHHGRLYGSRWYDPRDGEGRTKSGTEVESDAGCQSRRRRYASMDGEGRECWEHILERMSGTHSRTSNPAVTVDEYRTYSGENVGNIFSSESLRASQAIKLVPTVLF